MLGEGKRGGGACVAGNHHCMTRGRVVMAMHILQGSSAARQTVSFCSEQRQILVCMQSFVQQFG